MVVRQKEIRGVLPSTDCAKQRIVGCFARADISYGSTHTHTHTHTDRQLPGHQLPKTARTPSSMYPTRTRVPIPFGHGSFQKEIVRSLEFVIFLLFGFFSGDTISVICTLKGVGGGKNSEWPPLDFSVNYSVASLITFFVYILTPTIIIFILYGIFRL
jgi:hypothetical protein